jgi:hypothetical protein
MGRHIHTCALLLVSAGVLAGGYMVGPAPRAMALAANVSDSTQAQRPATSILSSRPPVPLLLGSRGKSTPDAPGLPLLDEKAPSGTTARAAIETDGYTKVKALIKGPDGVWHGRAMRGAVEVAVSVDAAGSVSTQ